MALSLKVRLSFFRLRVSLRSGNKQINSGRKVEVNDATVRVQSKHKVQQHKNKLIQPNIMVNHFLYWITKQDYMVHKLWTDSDRSD